MSGSASWWITILALLAAGILAASALIISKKPSAKELIDKLVPFQGALGVGLLAWGLIDLLRSLGHLGDFMRFWPLGGGIFLVAVGSEIILGFLFGMPLIAKWIPGESSAEAKALQMQKKVAGMSVLFGIIGIAAALGLMLMYFGVIKPGT
jgi:hypothetical protein